MKWYKLGFLLFFVCVLTSCAAKEADMSETVKSEQVTDTSAIVELFDKTQSADTEPLETEISTTTRTGINIEALKDLPLSAKSFAASDDHVKPLGRNLFKNDIRMFTYTCSGIEFEFFGTSASIDVICGGKARVAVYVNDELTEDIILDNGETSLDVFAANEAQYNKITFRKLSEMGYNYVGVKSINVTSQGMIYPSAEKAHSIEYIGDSVTCGYGIDNDNFGNGSKSYAALVAERFDVDYSICACGGIGVYSAYTEGNTPNRDSLIGELYDKQAIDNEIWDFSQQYDLIVINMGSNDNVWVRGIDEREQRFGEAYYELIAQVREANPDSYIICSYGVLSTGLMDEIRKQADKYSSENGDSKLYCFEYELQDIVRDGYGTNYHPSAKTHENMANALSDYISELLGMYIIQIS
ncbi:MAG: hypothetical protein K2J76_01115, partial [Oscillospiraceae bacterium]|nr:hypothetical protein [Oscillospiraceae bacterium]